MKWRRRLLAQPRLASAASRQLGPVFQLLRPRHAPSLRARRRDCWSDRRAHHLGKHLLRPLRDSSVDAEEFGKRFANLPKTVGPVGRRGQQGRPEDARSGRRREPRSRRVPKRRDGRAGRPVAGRGPCSRHWPAHAGRLLPQPGFLQDGNKQKHRIEVPGEEPATFYTARFRHETALGPAAPTRVFWAWNANDAGGSTDWVAPDNQRTLLRQQHGAVQDVLHRHDAGPRRAGEGQRGRWSSPR